MMCSLSLCVLDVDECKGAHGCSHQCMNSAGSYQCVCADGFRLAQDRRSCLSLCALPLPPHPTVASQSEVDNHLSTNNNRGEKLISFNSRGDSTELCVLCM